MLDKIRLYAAGELPPEYHPFLGVATDGRCVHYLGIAYDKLVERVLKGGTDEEIFEWSQEQGRRLTTDEIEIWSDFSRKRGLRDDPGTLAHLETRKRESGLADRSDIDTYFLYNDADEGRL